ncbi:bystin family protein [Babesia ovis]|uniref:Bystin family protein n=1 Tax=Babesia ovis TaxID=5869 RepID=A0A9W5TEG9_BABOV|nr:bystin family protein [Babesia ovis]
MKQKLAKKGAKGRASAHVKKEDNPKKKGRQLKAREPDDDDDLSDIEAEYLEDIPEAIAKKIHKLANENDHESVKIALVNDADFLEQDTLVSGTLKEVDGFLPESALPSSSIEIGQLSERLFKVPDAESESMRKMRTVFTDIGTYMSKYTSGGLPKAFKVLPRMANWEEFLALTHPENWTPNAMYEATRILASNLTDTMAEIFYIKVLLPTVRKDIRNNRKLNYHLYMALKKAMYKPTAWFKGIMVPLVEEGCIYREAAIIGNVLRRISIPVLHASAFILRLCQCQKWFGSSSFIMSILLQKKYNLPKNVVQECVQYFCKFENFEDQLPVIWHQSLLTLVTSYKHYFTPADYASIQRLTRVHTHPHITPVINHLLSCTITEVEM